MQDHASDVLGIAHANLTERLADAMRAVSRAYVSAVVTGLAEQGFSGLTAATLSILGRAPVSGIQTVALARATGRTKQATGKLIDELEAAGYIERTEDPEDRRGRLVRPTARGSAALALGAQIKARLSDRAFDVLGAEAMERLYGDLAALEGVLLGPENA